MKSYPPYLMTIYLIILKQFAHSKVWDIIENDLDIDLPVWVCLYHHNVVFGYNLYIYFLKTILSISILEWEWVWLT